MHYKKSIEVDEWDLIVVGGGAAGFFGAIHAATLNPRLRILILEKTSKLLSKVKVSGGGRCNVTHACFEAHTLSQHYPRGEKKLRSMFKSFDAKAMVQWLASKGVELKAEDDGRMFPVTDNSQTIIDCFIREALRLSIKIEMDTSVSAVEANDDALSVITNLRIFKAKKILVAVGGNPNPKFYDWIEKLGHHIISPIPSLFTFNDPSKNFAALMGVAVENAEVRIVGTKLVQRGPVLITHWGLSGPAIIKLSAWAAEYLHTNKYEFNVLVSWIGPFKEEDIKNQLLHHKQKHGKQRVMLNALFSLPNRLWVKLCELSEIDSEKIWAELPQRNINKLMESIIRCAFYIRGKTTFKEEFVTCGGVDLNEIDLETMQSKKLRSIYFAGEVLNIDGETGGFNFQAAWTGAYIAARSIART